MAFIRRESCRFCSWRKTCFLTVALLSAFTFAVVYQDYLFLFMQSGQLKFPSISSNHVNQLKEAESLRQSKGLLTSSRSAILLFVGIYSAPIRIDRRNAIRETWKRRCEKNAKVVCWFITDGQDTHGKVLQGEVRSRLENENLVYGDMLFAQSPGGVNFGRRYLWMAEWATQRHNFQYLLRVDDDYFVCLDKLVMELEGHRPMHNFTWGWLHCIGEGAVVIDEGFVVITKDLIESFLWRKNSTLLCHPHGGQSIGLWLNDLTNVTTFGDNKRLLQHGIVSKEKAAKRPEICHTLLGIHRSYPDEMKMYWDIYQKENKSIAHKPPPVAFPCRYPRGLNYTALPGVWFAKPELCKLCKDNPIWDRGEYFKGRGEK